MSTVATAGGQLFTKACRRRCLLWRDALCISSRLVVHVVADALCLCHPHVTSDSRPVLLVSQEELLLSIVIATAICTLLLSLLPERSQDYAVRPPQPAPQQANSWAWCQKRSPLPQRRTQIFASASLSSPLARTLRAPS